MTRKSHHCSVPATSRRRHHRVTTTQPHQPHQGVCVSSRPRRSSPPVSAVECYVVAVHQEIVRLSIRQYGADAPHDVAQDVVETLLGKIDRIMAHYADPVVYARVAYRHATVQAGRRDRVQRGEGSRLFTRADGTRAPGHVVVSGDAVTHDDDRCLFDTLEGRGEAIDDAVAAFLDARRQISQAWHAVSRRDRSAYFAVRGLGYPVTEVAASLGIRRETLQRRLAHLDGRVG